ncbi:MULTISPECIES: PilZ domain-containing protein [Acinetobacter]|uniref:Pilus assembly protein n=1 Tax=Acinetobacter piscicola TaxID=2006115 RepID=A0A4Q4H1B5_9GAMM|nr:MULTISPECIES: PilZ domain-containing protein [Acinetobacter]MDM1756562.1 PilZ domain-containing protein [Acinetobacter sp. 256-1]MDM1759712.1 PilZ domain-containing protein [Acinetobacter sp. 251-1]QOW47887.1 pilus assembly protein [Acinetobacter piscicola]RYL28673.1 pilus assembly protein [Acinetobacter piscicola]
MQPRMGGLLQVVIADRATLQASYMSFVQGGGLFVPSNQAVKMGEEVFLLATLPEQSQKIPLTGKVIWISQKQSGKKPQGFAIQLSGEKGVYYKNEAEKLLAGVKASERNSFTM